MIVIRPYHQADTERVGRLIADTYSKFNLSSAPPEERPLYLGPFKHARSHEESHQAAIAQVIRAAMVFVAEDAGDISDENLPGLSRPANCAGDLLSLRSPAFFTQDLLLRSIPWGLITFRTSADTTLDSL